jgi:photosynthetic reaction center H subunit
MRQGLILTDIDLAQVVLYAFWIFFAGLLIYLRREDKREGYPLESERSAFVTVQGFPKAPGPKSFLLADGAVVTVPRKEIDNPNLRAEPLEVWHGAPLKPTGNPMVDGVGPASYSERANIPDTTFDGHIRIVPMRVAKTHTIEGRDPDPRGMDVIGADGEVAGKVTDAWVDRSEAIIRYLEVEVAGGAAVAGKASSGGRKVLLPINFTRIDGRRRRVKVESILASQFGDVPTTASADQVTRREEDRITAYYGGGTLYAVPSRQEPIL